MDHVIRYHDDPNVKMIVVLGEVSGVGLSWYVPDNFSPISGAFQTNTYLIYGAVDPH